MENLRSLETARNIHNYGETGKPSFSRVETIDYDLNNENQVLTMAEEFRMTPDMIVLSTKAFDIYQQEGLIQKDVVLFRGRELMGEKFVPALQQNNPSPIYRLHKNGETIVITSDPDKAIAYLEQENNKLN
jgi:hypothetical protein